MLWRSFISNCVVLLRRVSVKFYGWLGPRACRVVPRVPQKRARVVPCSWHAVLMSCRARVVLVSCRARVVPVSCCARAVSVSLRSLGIFSFFFLLCCCVIRRLKWCYKMYVTYGAWGDMYPDLVDETVLQAPRSHQRDQDMSLHTP